MKYFNKDIYVQNVMKYHMYLLRYTKNNSYSQNYIFKMKYFHILISIFKIQIRKNKFINMYLKAYEILKSLFINIIFVFILLIIHKMENQIIIEWHVKKNEIFICSLRIFRNQNYIQINKKILSKIPIIWVYMQSKTFNFLYA